MEIKTKPDAIDYSACERHCRNIFDEMSSGYKFITKVSILDILSNSGISEDDIRIEKLIGKLHRFSHTENINFEVFKDIASDNINLFEKAVSRSFVIPDLAVFKKEIESSFNETKKNTSGKVANYIPQLACVDPEQFAVAFCSVDGQMITLGDYLHPYCVQSTAKPITYCIATELNGEDKVHKHVGREPSGVTFNAIALNKYNLPHNPMINSGAIMVCSLIKPEWSVADRFEHVAQTWQDLFGGESIGFDKAIYHSEKETADRNYALAHYMKEVGAFPSKANIHTSLDLYFQTCSIEVNAQKMAKIMSTIANGGICPFTNKKIFSPTTVRNCLSMMYSCGMYDFSGEYAFSVGLPAKSGVSGALIIVIPNVGAFAIFSPRLDSNHNSARGVEFSKRLVNKFSFHNYDHVEKNDKINPVGNLILAKSHLTFELIWAASLGDLSEVKRMLALGVDINKGDYDERTALHLASAEGHVSIVSYLISKGANVNAIDRWKRKPTDDAKINNNKVVLKILNNALKL